MADEVSFNTWNQFNAVGYLATTQLMGVKMVYYKWTI